jgi:hypothetical protein
MPDLTPARRLPVLLAGGYVSVAGYVIVYTWLTVHAYTRIVFEPQPVERGIALRDCQAAPACAPDAYDLVHAQESILDSTITLVRGTAWLMVVVQVVVMAVVTVSVVTAHRRHRTVSPAVVRFTGIAWKAQAAVAGMLLLGYAAMLMVGANLLADTPDPATMLTYAVAYSSPFLDVGTLYYLAWFIVMNGAGIALTRILARSVQASSASALSASEQP